MATLVLDNPLLGADPAKRPDRQPGTSGGPSAVSLDPSSDAAIMLRVAAGVTVLWFVVRQVGTGPFMDGLRAVTWPAVAGAVTLTALTTVCSAWRWRVVARALGVGIGLPAAIGAYYRSLFLNSVLIGGGLASRRGRRSCCFVGLLLGEGAVVHLNPPADDAATCAYQFSGATKEGQDADYGEHVAHAVVSPGFSEHQ